MSVWSKLGQKIMLITPDKKDCSSNGYSESHYPQSTKEKPLKNGFSHPVTNGTIPNITQVKHTPQESKEEFEEISYLVLLAVYLSYAVLMVFGYLRDFMRKIGVEKNFKATEKNREGYLPLYRNFECFYTRNIYRRICDVFDQPIASVPGATILLKERTTKDYNVTFNITNKLSELINMGSYNYLGFADNSGKCIDSVEDCIKKYGISTCSTRHELGSLDIHDELEKLIAEFLGVEDSIIMGMGFATNSTSIPTLASKGSLIISDEFNHASLVLGCRLSGAKVRVFKHNNMKDLECVIRTAILEGQPCSHRPWKKIILVLEGIYSMEGTIVYLPAVLALKKKYKCYLYVDEAHSIGAIGPRGRGVVDYFGIDPKEVDLLMGTFSKSFGAVGGYIAGSKETINYLRHHVHSSKYATTMSAAIVQQTLFCMKTIMGIQMGDEGLRRIQKLRRNTHYFRKKLKQMGFIVYGNEDSPVVPLIVYFPSKLAEFVRLLLKEGIATVGVGFPATPLVSGRIRFCISAAHTKEMLDKTLAKVGKVGQRMMVDYSRKQRSQENVIY